MVQPQNIVTNQPDQHSATTTAVRRTDASLNPRAPCVFHVHAAHGAMSATHDSARHAHCANGMDRWRTTSAPTHERETTAELRITQPIQGTRRVTVTDARRSPIFAPAREAAEEVKPPLATPPAAVVVRSEDSARRVAAPLDERDGEARTRAEKPEAAAARGGGGGARTLAERLALEIPALARGDPVSAAAHFERDLANRRR